MNSNFWAGVAVIGGLGGFAYLLSTKHGTEALKMMLATAAVTNLGNMLLKGIQQSQTAQPQINRGW